MKIIHMFANYMPVYVYIIHAFHFISCLCAFHIHFNLPFPVNKKIAISSYCQILCREINFVTQDHVNVIFIGIIIFVHISV